jgi:bleomycin hydrolase
MYYVTHLPEIHEKHDRMRNDDNVKLVTSALYTNSIAKLSKNPHARIDTDFSNEIPKLIEPLNQYKTGTCWLQAGLTMISTLAKKNGIDFIPSVTHLMFYDKLERSTVFLHRMLQHNTSKEALDDRTMHFLLDEPICDGGTFSMFAFLIQKYGITTLESYPQTFQAKHSAQLNRVLAQYLRQVSSQVTSTEILESHIFKVHEIITMCLSLPPVQINLYQKSHGLAFTGTPKKLFDVLNKFIGIESFVCLNDAPNKTVKSCVVFPTNNYQKMDQHTFHVTDIEKIKQACVVSLKLQKPVWFTSTVRGGADFSRKLMICDAVEYEKLFAIENSMSKKEKMDCRSIQPSHAMLLVGVHCDANDKPVRWKVQNSWGKETAFLTMSDEWFSQNVFEIAVPNYCCANDFTSEVDYNSIEYLKPWDLLSTVAQ